MHRCRVQVSCTGVVYRCHVQDPCAPCDKPKGNRIHSHSRIVESSSPPYDAYYKAVGVSSFTTRIIDMRKKQAQMGSEVFGGVLSAVHHDVGN